MTQAFSSLREAQLTMARHLRDPNNAPAPEGVEPRRLKVYQDLIYNNIEGFISSGFPVLHSLYDKGDWRELVESFIDNHHCQTPYFLEISQEFIRYLAQDHKARSIDPGFAAELAHYEWVELALDVSEAEPPPLPPLIDPLGLEVQMAPLAWLLSYTYPVHRIGRAFRPERPLEPCYLVVYRDRSDEVGFMELNAATARLLQLVQEESGRSGGELLDQLADELNSDPEAVRAFGAQQLEQFVHRSIVALVP